jgi:hypothetical protein
MQIVLPALCGLAALLCQAGRPANAASVIVVAQAQSSSVKALFEKYNLLGTFAWDCSKPADRTNLYYVHRAIDEEQVQRDQMSGPTTRDFALIFERGFEVRPREIALSGARDGQPAESVYRVEPTRMRVLEGTVAGKKEVAGGKLISTGRDMPWLNKCG